MLYEVITSWLKSMLTTAGSVDFQSLTDDIRLYIEILRSYYLFDKESKDYALAKAMVARAGIESADALFKIFVKLGIFDEDENIDLLRCNLSVAFSEQIVSDAEHIIRSGPTVSADASRRDLTHLELITIDGQGTLDFDDASYNFV